MPEREAERALRVAVVTNYPPSQGSLNEYAYHFVRAIRAKAEVGAVVVLADAVPDAVSDAVSDAVPNAVPAAVTSGTGGGTAPGGGSGTGTGGGSGTGTGIADEPGLAPVERIACWRYGSWGNAWRIVRAIRRERPDVVLFNVQFASFANSSVPAALGLAAPALVRACGFPTIVLLHNLMDTIDLASAGFARHRWRERLLRAGGGAVTRLLLRADLVALTIPRYVELLAAKYGANNVVLAPHGAFTELPTPDFALPEGPLQILTFGKFGTYKRIEPLLDALVALRRDRPAGARPVELVVAGSDSPNTPGYLDGVRQRYAAVPGVRFTGYVAEEAVPGIFTAAAVVVFPYTSTTGSSGVLHQAGEYGRAAVLPHIGDFAEVIAEEGYTGEFFAPEDAEDLARALARVLDDPARRLAIAEQNYRAALGLPLADVIDWYLLHFQQLLAPGRRDV